jgi:hypothetical protein
METVYVALAGAIVALHLLFVVFATVGGLLVLRLPVLAVAHLPAVVWAAFVELTGRLCPLTPLENSLRERAGLERYSGDFIAQYVFPVLYPEGLTRETQMLFGLLVLAINAIVYGTLVWRYVSARKRQTNRVVRSG